MPLELLQPGLPRRTAEALACPREFPGHVLQFLPTVYWAALLRPTITSRPLLMHPRMQRPGPVLIGRQPPSPSLFPPLSVQDGRGTGLLAGWEELVRRKVQNSAVYWACSRCPIIIHFGMHIE